MNKIPKGKYVVIFTSTLNEEATGYTQMAQTMEKLVKEQVGFLGMTSVRDKIGITISYWDSLESINLWRNNEHHQKAKTFGKKEWYADYDITICQII
jgi:heme-degrading monooxygenase HmoA